MNRPGPYELWAHFDEAVARVAGALAGSSPAELAAAFTSLSEVCGALAAQVRAAEFADDDGEVAVLDVARRGLSSARAGARAHL